MLEFDAPKAGAEAGRGTQFEDAHSWRASSPARTSTRPRPWPTSRKSLNGHAVLAALACDQIIMAPRRPWARRASTKRSSTTRCSPPTSEIARSRHHRAGRGGPGPVGQVAAGAQGQHRGEHRIRHAGRLDELARQHPILSQETIKPAGEPWQFTGAEGRKWGFVDFLADDRRDVVRALELSADVVVGDPLAADRLARRSASSCRGSVTADKVSQLERIIDEEVRNGANFVCLWIESPGGSPLESMNLATAPGPARPRTGSAPWRIFRREARADAAMIAMACDQIVMHPQAVLGGPGAYQMSDEETARYRQTLRDSLARDKMRSWSLWAAMIDPQSGRLPLHAAGRRRILLRRRAASAQPKPRRRERRAVGPQGSRR